MSTLKIVAALFALASLPPVVAAAQSGPSTDKAPVDPTSNDASYGTPVPPASTEKSPVSMNPTAARKEGTAPASPGAAPPAKP